MKIPVQIDEEKLNVLKNYPLGYRLQQLREWNHYTQEEFAMLTGTRQASVSGWERGLYVPNIRSLEKIISAYHLPDDFFADVRLQKIRVKRKKGK